MPPSPPGSRRWIPPRPTPPDRPSRLNNLGVGLRDRYDRSGRLEDLDAAIAAYEQALSATPPDSPARPSRLTNLGARAARPL
jgi:hypothetical protein